jgi:hypothetical protein
MHTVVARFHHDSRDLSEIENDLVAQGAEEAVITRYTVAMTIDADSREEATAMAQQFLDGIGATRTKITRHGIERAQA